MKLSFTNVRYIIERYIGHAATFFLVSCSVCLAVTTIDWPLVNDPALMHYISFLIAKGMVPYRDIGDINMPGSYAVDWVVMKVMGTGDLAWRLFDFSLMLAAGAAMLAVAGPGRLFAGVFAAALFALLHGRDGVGQAGQRDLTAAVLLLWAHASLVFFFHRSGAKRWLFFFGLCIGCAVSIKPPALLFLFLLAALPSETRHKPRGLIAPLVFSILGLAAPLLAVCVYLARKCAFMAFLETLRGDVVYHASLGRHSLGYLFTWSAPAAIWLLAAMAAVLCVRSESWRAWETKMLLISVSAGLFFYLVQGKGFLYQRYPFVAFLLLWSSLELAAALRQGRIARAVACVGLAFGLVLAPMYLSRASKETWDTRFTSKLETDLNTLGGSELSGHVQCVDSISGCVPALYQMGLVQSTGIIYDEFLFAPKPSTLLRENEASFLSRLTHDPPQVIVVSRWLFTSGPDQYRKLAMWPAFDDYLSANYLLYVDREFPAAATGPEGYRIYIRID